MVSLQMNHEVAIYYKVCKVTKKYYSVVIPVEKYKELQSPNRTYIQDILPEYTNDEREFIIS